MKCIVKLKTLPLRITPIHPDIQLGSKECVDRETDSELISYGSEMKLLRSGSKTEGSSTVSFISLGIVEFVLEVTGASANAPEVVIYRVQLLFCSRRGRGRVILNYHQHIFALAGGSL